MPTHHVYLVPGFFGFANLGQITYFGHVRRFLAEQLRARGLEAHLHVVRVRPTASLPRRSAELAERIAATARGREAAVHHGTPLASFFATLRGQKLLQLVSLGTIHVLRFGHLPLAVVLALGAFVARLDDLAVNSDLLDEVFERLLGDFSPGRRRSVGALLDEVVRDQALLPQLTPEAMEVFHASVSPRSSVRYACVVTQAARPRLRSRLAAGLDPAAQVSRSFFGALYRLAAETPRRLAPHLEPAQARALRRGYGAMPAPSANDGIVPTRSQTWGRVLHTAVADHLDVLGHFRADDESPHVDWLFSGSRFDRRRFEALWGDVAGFIAKGGS